MMKDDPTVQQVRKAMERLSETRPVGVVEYCLEPDYHPRGVRFDGGSVVAICPECLLMALDKIRWRAKP